MGYHLYYIYIYVSKVILILNPELLKKKRTQRQAHYGGRQQYFSEQVIIHAPDGFPDVTTAYKIHAERDRITRISVSVAQVQADDSLNRLEDWNSQCYLYRAIAKNLNSLVYKSSNEDTCFIKCRMRAIYQACNCTQYFFKLYKGAVSRNNLLTYKS